MKEWEEQREPPKHPENKELRRRKSRILGPQEPREGSFQKDDGHGMQKRAPEDAEQEKALDLAGDLLESVWGWQKGLPACHG